MTWGNTGPPYLATKVHVHQGSPGAIGLLMAAFCNSETACAAVEGRRAQVVIPPQFRNDVVASNVYFNFHSINCTDGAARGNGELWRGINDGWMSNEMDVD